MAQAGRAAQPLVHNLALAAYSVPSTDEEVIEAERIAKRAKVRGSEADVTAKMVCSAAMREYNAKALHPDSVVLVNERLAAQPGWVQDVRQDVADVQQKMGRFEQTMLSVQRDSAMMFNNTSKDFDDALRVPPHCLPDGSFVEVPAGTRDMFPKTLRELHGLNVIKIKSLLFAYDVAFGPDEELAVLLNRFGRQVVGVRRNIA